LRPAPLLLALALGACAPRGEPPGPPLVLDCTLSYQALSQRVMAEPGLTQAPQEPGEPYRFYRQGDGAVAYVFTQPGAPGHPAILRQEAVREGGARRMNTTGCPYGDKAGFDQVMAYLQRLS
jgi:hypothetical protein